MYRKAINTFGLFILLAILFSGCSKQPISDTIKEGLENVSLPQLKIDAKFADYKEVPVDYKPAVNDYQIAGDLSNIINKDMFDLSEVAKELLIKNGFVVVPNDYNREFFMLYEMSRYQPVPLFVTTDSLLHNYHLFFNHLLKSLEEEKFSPELIKLSRAMQSASIKQYEILKGTSWENAAKRNVGFFSVGAKLLDPQTVIPQVVGKEVQKELALIDKHQGVDISPVMNLGGGNDPLELLMEDYSQYIPRGHYDKSDTLRSYFKAMMWYGRMTFRLKNEDEIKSAVLMTVALNHNGNYQSWEQIYTPTNFFVGKSDDITFVEFNELVKEIYGTNFELATFVADLEKWDRFIKAVNKLQPPLINSIPIFDETIQPDREREIKGFRFMGQRFTIDAFIFQRLVYREVKENSQNERRMLPKGLDIPAALGSREAYDILKAMGETDYRDYSRNMALLQEGLTYLDQGIWTQNLYWGWLYSLLPLTWEKPEGYPSFMRNQAWARKDLNTFLGSWTELKHDTVLYAKQVYAEAGGGGDDIDDRGYVEPNPYVYGRLASLVRMTREGLKAKELLDYRDEINLERMEELALSLKTIAEKELSNIPLTDEEFDLIRGYGVQLEHFWLEAMRREGIDHRSAVHDRPAALVTDVATDIDGGLVLQEATGYISDIYVVVPVEDKLRIAIGGVYSYYEFPWPLADRLTDTRWHQMLDKKEAPPLPAWTNTFVVNE